jgi:hypothetical protein
MAALHKVVAVVAAAAAGVVAGTAGGMETALDKVADSRPELGSDSCVPTAPPTGRLTVVEELECFAADLQV